MDTKDEPYAKIIKKHYLELLGRKPDKDGFEHYLWLLQNGTFDEQMLINDIKNSAEYKKKLEFRKN